MTNPPKSNVIINDPDTSTLTNVTFSDKSKANPSPQSLPLPVKLVKSVVNFFFDFLETIVVALSIFVVIYLFILQPHEIKGSSMEPNFHNNEYILTDKISYRFKDPQRGNIIVFKAPKNPDIDYIKRIIGLPGESVKIEKGDVYVNDQKLKEQYIHDKSLLFPGSFMQEGVSVTVPPGEYFVMGDNRPHSSDSREFGPIPKNSIIGKAFVRYWPLNEVGIISGVNYLL